MRAFAISLTNNPDLADDLVQEALTKAWANIDRFQPGSNLNAWLFTIREMRSSNYRSRKREVENPQDNQAVRLATAPEQHAGRAVGL
jgi:RNA polymerase sigma-70 factor, ECF subfamily